VSESGQRALKIWNYNKRIKIKKIKTDMIKKLYLWKLFGLEEQFFLYII